VLGEEHPDTLASSHNLATVLAGRAKYAEAEAMLQVTLEACRRVLGSAHPQTHSAEEWLEHVRSSMRAEQPTKKVGKAAARRNERAAAPALSSTALAEAEARASAAEAELLAMLDLEEPEVAARADGRSGFAKSKTRGKARGKGGKR
jgi:multidrug resistance efflux pump